jgi:hypothetical protein
VALAGPSGSPRARGKLTRSKSGRPRHTRTLGDEISQAGSALAAALDLSDGTSSVVVLQADGDEGTAGWASFLPHVLAGQTAVYILRQQPGESLDALDARVRGRIASADPETQRVLWVTTPDAPVGMLDALRPTLAKYCSRDRDVLLVSGANVMLMAPPARADEAVEADGLSSSATAQTSAAGGGGLAESRPGPAPGRVRPRSEPVPAPSTPEHSEVRWESPVVADADDPSSRSA